MKIDPNLKEELKQYVKSKLSSKSNRVTLISPYTLGDKELSLLKEGIPQLSGAELHQEVDPTIMAGVIIKFGSKMIDLSLKGELLKLQQRIYEIA